MPELLSSDAAERPQALQDPALEEAAALFLHGSASSGRGERTTGEIAEHVVAQVAGTLSMCHPVAVREVRNALATFHREQTPRSLDAVIEAVTCAAATPSAVRKGIR